MIKNYVNFTSSNFDKEKFLEELKTMLTTNRIFETIDEFQKENKRLPNLVMYSNNPRIETSTESGLITVFTDRIEKDKIYLI